MKQQLLNYFKNAYGFNRPGFNVKKVITPLYGIYSAGYGYMAGRDNLALKDYLGIILPSSIGGAGLGAGIGATGIATWERLAKGIPFTKSLRNNAPLITGTITKVFKEAPAYTLVPTIGGYGVGRLVHRFSRRPNLWERLRHSVNMVIE